MTFRSRVFFAEILYNSNSNSYTSNSNSFTSRYTTHNAYSNNTSIGNKDNINEIV